MNTTAQNRSVEARVRGAIVDLLRERLGPYGFRNARVMPGVDHDGDPVLFIDAEYDLSDVPVNSRATTLDTLVDLRRKLSELGEERFPHIRHHFAEKQKVVGFKK
jgi:hypothetical protein